VYNKENVRVDQVKVDEFSPITIEEVEKAIKRMKNGKATGHTEVVSEMFKASGEVGLSWIRDLTNLIVTQECIPKDWCNSILVPVYKGKGDPMDCGSYRAVKLLEHTMKIVERILESRLREQVNIEELQFGFMPGRGTVDAIFIARQMQEKYRAKKKDLYFAFIDLEKAFDRVPRDVLHWALSKAGVEEWLIKAIMVMYNKCSTSVKVGEGLSEPFEVKVGVHQGSVLSPLLFVIVMDVIAKELGGVLPWELMYADDLLLMADSEDEIREKVRRWKDGLENKGLKVNVSKTKLLVLGNKKREERRTSKWPCSICNKGVGGNSVVCTKCRNWVHKRCSGVKGKLGAVELTFVCDVCLKGRKECKGVIQEGYLDLGEGTVIERVESYCYLGDVLNNDGDVKSAIVARIRNGWKKFKDLSPILTDKKVSLHLKGKLYQSCVRPCMIYASETWAFKQEDLNRLVRAERQMVRSMCNVSLMDRKSSSVLLDMLGINTMEEVIRCGRLRWFGHVERKSDGDWIRKCMSHEVTGTRPKGRPDKTWLNSVLDDVKKLGLKRKEAQDRALWRRKIRRQD